MLVSNFELLIKRIAPIINQPGFQDTNAIARRAVQGYFLTISNQSNRRVYLKVRAVFSAETPPNTTDPNYQSSNRELVPINGTLTNNNYLYAFDIVGGSTLGQTQIGALNFPTIITSEVTGFTAAKSGFVTIKLERNQTGSFQLIPNVLNDDIREAANMEVRGYVELFQSCVSEPQGTNNTSVKLTGNYLSTAANIMVTPEHRGTILPNDFTPEFDPAINKIGDLDNYAYSLPLAYGSALYQLPPIMGSMQFGRVLNAGSGIEDDFMTAYQNADDKQKMRMVLAVNDFLKANKIPISPLKFTK